MSAPVLILGGGVAGSATAILLARAGERVVLFDQHREPRHKVCGEFLSVEACDSLGRLGLNLDGLGALPLQTVRLLCGAIGAEAPLPFPALSLTRKRLDAEMLRLAAEAGAALQLGSRVDTLSQITPCTAAQHGPPENPRLPSSVHVHLADGTKHRGSSVFLATGKHDLREQRRPGARGPKLVAFKQYFRLRPAAYEALRGAIELHLFRGGYAGLQLVETGEANLCLLIEQRRVAALGGWPGVLRHITRHAPQLRDRLAGAPPVLPQPLALSHIPYGFLADPECGPWRIGDQAAVIPSFTGDGISIALHSARLAVDAYLNGQRPEQYITQLRTHLGRNMGRSRLLARALLTPGLQELSVALASRAPSLLARFAAATRIQPGALQEIAKREHGDLHAATAYNDRG